MLRKMNKAFSEYVNEELAIADYKKAKLKEFDDTYKKGTAVYEAMVNQLKGEIANKREKNFERANVVNEEFFNARHKIVSIMSKPVPYEVFNMLNSYAKIGNLTPSEKTMLKDACKGNYQAMRMLESMMGEEKGIISLLDDDNCSISSGDLLNDLDEQWKTTVDFMTNFKAESQGLNGMLREKDLNDFSNKVNSFGNFYGEKDEDGTTEGEEGDDDGK